MMATLVFNESIIQSLFTKIRNSRNRGYLNIKHLKAIVDKTKRIEEEISNYVPKKRSNYLKK